MFFAQNETNHWYFGDKAAIDFSLGKRVIKNDSEMNTPAGCSSISDKEGNLLFYTNGQTVWNKNHEIMENGEGLPAGINNTQTSIIIPQPGSTGIYYIFSTKIASSTNPVLARGLYLSTVEVSNSFPLGQVQSRAQRLKPFSTEKITAVHSKDGKSIWVIALGSSSSASDILIDTFFTYNISESGLAVAEVTIQEEILSTNGVMKVSPDGKIIAIADYSEETIFLYNFDNETGNINFKEFFFTNTDFGVKLPYGIAFSSDSQTLYYTSNGSINRFLLENPFPNNPLFNVKAPLFNAQSDNFGSLQLANDGKIYVASYIPGENSNIGVNHLTVIDNVNSLSPTFSYQSLDLESGSSLLGLPVFIQSYFVNRITTEDKCVTETFNFEVSAYTNIESVLWDFGDGNTTTELSPKHNYTSSGVYTVIANITLNGEVSKVYKSVEAFALPNLKSDIIITQCDDDFDGLSNFNLLDARTEIANFTNFRNVNFKFYTTQNDALNNTDNNIKAPENFENTSPNQEVFTRVESEKGCVSFTSFRVNARFIQLGNISDVYACETTGPNAIDNEANFNTEELETKIRNEIAIASDTTLRFYSTFSDALNNTGEFFFNFTKPTTTIYIKAQEADLSCGGITSINLIVNPKPVINIEDEYTICFNPSLKPPIIISADSSNDRFEWKNSQGNIISTNKDFTLNTVGEFSLTAYKSENGLLCTNTKKFTVINPDKATFSTVKANTEDETNNIIEVIVNGNSNYEFSLDNSNFFGDGNSYTFTNVQAGLRTVYVRDLNSCEQPIEAKITVIGFKKFFTPNEDGINDFWNIRGIDATSFKSIDIMIFDRFGKITGTITDFNSAGWDGTYNGKKLIANNYWFKAKIIDKDDNLIENTGNFSLIRN